MTKKMNTFTEEQFEELRYYYYDRRFAIPEIARRMGVTVYTLNDNLKVMRDRERKYRKLVRSHKVGSVPKYNTPMEAYAENKNCDKCFYKMDGSSGKCNFLTETGIPRTRYYTVADCPGSRKALAKNEIDEWGRQR